MKLHILSDLHIEFSEFTPPSTDADAVVLAGDIGVGLGGIDWAARHFSQKPVIYVPGNHEYYYHDLSLVDDLKANARPNIHILDGDSVEIRGVRFVGSTLWTDFELFGEGEKFHAMSRAGHQLEDFSCIQDGGRAFTPEKSTQLHGSGKAYLKESFAVAHDGPTVVVTHHLPSTMSIAKKFATDPLSPAFASRLEPLIERGRPEVWIHGHTHESCDYEIFETRVVCNPRGYPGEVQDQAFDPHFVIRF